MITAIIAAAGSGSRMGRGVNKVLLTLGGEPILAHTLRLFSSIPEIDEFIVVTGEADIPAVQKMTDSLLAGKQASVIKGGSERQFSIANALEAASVTSELILVHDGARPFVRSAVVHEVLAAARLHQAAGVAVPVKDTIKITDAQGFATATPDRNTLWSMQTPQVFSAPLLRQAYRQAAQDGYLGTDDASLVERLGVPVKLIRGNYSNIKITTPEDLISAAGIAGQQGGNTVRVGTGYDVHRLTEGRRLVLGGVEIPHTLGLEGHSDADVLLHAIKDALLGAAALGDIGRHFPDNDPRYKGISSLLLLRHVGELLRTNGWRVNNVDATVVAEKPKLSPYIPAMNENIARTLEVSANQINIKATTTEGLGFAGNQQGMAAYAIVSIMRLEGE